MTILEEDGKKYVMLKVEVKDLDDAKKGDYVDHRGKVYQFMGYDYGTYAILEDQEGNQIEIGP
jgi:hypothetical protein